RPDVGHQLVASPLLGNSGWRPAYLCLPLGPHRRHHLIVLDARHNRSIYAIFAVDPQRQPHTVFGDRGRLLLSLGALIIAESARPNHGLPINSGTRMTSR